MTRGLDLNELLAGKTARRRAWRDGEYIIICRHRNDGVKELGRKMSDGRIIRYQLIRADISADDWSYSQLPAPEEESATNDFALYLPKRFVFARQSTLGQFCARTHDPCETPEVPGYEVVWQNGERQWIDKESFDDVWSRISNADDLLFGLRI